MTRRAVVLFNLGGPDSLDAVRPFLFNLFSDPAIIGGPWPLRPLIAWALAARREAPARAIYAKLGGRSPILAETEAQARALTERLGEGTRVFIAMRYWQPRCDAVAREVKAWGAEEIVLLPLYPQYSGTTSGSSLAEWQREAAGQGLGALARALCCYPEAPGLVAAQARLVAEKLDEAAAKGHGNARLLLSAHGLPKKIVERGDPYQWQVERTARAVVEKLGRPGLDWRVCYQSRVGPLEWIGPSTEAEIERAGREQRAVVVNPIAFVCEHSETLVELDVLYRELADKAGVPCYLRVPAVGTAPEFIAALAALVEEASRRPAGQVRPCAAGGQRLCPAKFRRCAMAQGVSA